MRRVLVIATLCLMLMASGEVYGQEVGHPRVGLALSGGGAKGAAHIGVLKYLVEQGVPIDYISGTSMGSIVGGLYAIGYTADQLDSLISNLDWSQYITGGLDRRYRSASSRMERSAYLLSVPFNLGTLDSNITEARRRGNGFIASLPGSFMGGNNITNLFNNLSLGYQDSMDFNDFPIPFACVATDVISGEEVVMRSGRFPTAIRASMAIPGVFSPVELGGKVLIDGGMTNNFPVDVCQDMGADYVIGVEVSDAMATDASQLRSLPQIFNQLISVTVQAKSARNRGGCKIYLHPDISGFGTMSFNKSAIDSLVRRGYECAKEHAAEIEALKQELLARGRKVADEERERNGRRESSVENDRLALMSIDMGTMSESDKKWLLSKTKLKTGVPISGGDIIDAINIFKGTGAYSAVSYRLSDVKGQSSVSQDSIKSYDLIFNFEPSPRHAFAIGARFDSEEAAAVLLNVGFNRNTLRGFKADVSLRLAQNFHLDLVGTYAARRFAKINLAYRLYNSRFDMGSLLSQRYYSTHFYRHDISFFFSEFYLYRFSGTAGVDEEFLLFDRLQGGNALLFGDDNLRTGSLGVFGTFKYDSRDDSYFARDGANVDLDARWRITNQSLAAPDSINVPGFADISAAYQHYITPMEGRFTLIPQLYTRFIIGSDYHFAYRNLVGGEMSGRYIAHQIPFVGVLTPQQTDRCVTVVRFDVRCNVIGKHYITAMANYMASADAYWHYFGKEYEDRYGFGLQYAYDSPVGPLSLTGFWSNVYKRFGVYLSLGYAF
ncbi:MAG: patatin-like phospholipase family protein [Bacteroidales bacterium]|nr:patatin-like phospholipase family protein [Bacteroidales bacterium]